MSFEPQTFASWVSPEEVTAQDRAWLELADEAGPAFNALPFERILAELRLGNMHLFRLRPQPGLLLVEVRVGATGIKRLGVVRSAGRNLGFLAREVAQVLQHIGRGWGCQQVETMVYSPRLAKAMTKVGARPESVNMVLEIENAS